MGPHSGSFQQGVDGRHFATLKDALLSMPCHAGIEPTETTDYYYESSKGRYRVIVDERLKVIQGQQLKTGLDSWTHLWCDDDTPYAVRCSVATETHMTAPLVLPPGHVWRRHKKRFSFPTYDSKHEVVLWTLDLTETSSSQTTGAQATAYEIEIELGRWLTLLTRNEPQRIQAMATKLWQFTRDTFERMLAADIVSFCGVACRRMSCSEKALGQFVQRQFAHRAPGFPGMLPVNYSRRHRTTLCNARYLVSDKSDGVRCLLLVHDGCFYLIDRLFVVMRIENVRYVAGRNRTFLVDGELVANEETGRSMYLAFDIVVFAGKPCREAHFEERYDKLGRFVQQCQRPAWQNHIVVHRKAFWKPSDMSLFAKHLVSDGAGCHRYRDDRCFHRIDGLILMPLDCPYQTSTAGNVFKWKYTDQISIDFRVRLSCDGKVPSFHLQNDDVTSYPVALAQDCNVRLVDDLQSCNSIIAELTFCPDIGQWYYNGHRKDKSQSNSYRVVFDTLLSIAENVTFEEIVQDLQRL
eukprot:TRINITY_DN4231_c0_g2_i1.p1 TRINITY_DN4231_c0_g2~~TRINITY_DN4231_c0_g2_i1.p1  ORF type:complete len:588 (-),score=59.31 TRINITY_DN4231_c0_g2_i1:37-1602(-)